MAVKIAWHDCGVALITRIEQCGFLQEGGYMLSHATASLGDPYCTAVV